MGGIVTHQENEAFQKPDNENSTIWRYLDFTKFVSLLDKQALYFARSDKLGDPFEGSYPKMTVKARPLTMRASDMSVFNEEIRQSVIINSWTMSEFESAAMWKLYSAGNKSVAIQSTLKRLAKSFDSYTRADVFIGQVMYIDYETEYLPEGNVFYPLLHKRRSFEHEHELRAMISKFPSNDLVEWFNTDLPQKAFVDGEYVDVNLDVLVESIFVSPASPPWFCDLIRSVVNKYSLSKKVTQSSLDNSPVF